MRAVIQRVKRASVIVNDQTVSEIGTGIVCLIGIREGDGPEQAEWLCKQILAAKLFEGMGKENADKRWRSSVQQNGFEVLLVSQASAEIENIVRGFGNTLHGECASSSRSEEERTVLRSVSFFLDRSQLRSVFPSTRHVGSFPPFCGVAHNRVILSSVCAPRSNATYHTFIMYQQPFSRHFVVGWAQNSASSIRTSLK